MIKSIKKTYGGILKDASPSQTPGLNYYDATYGRTSATDNNTEFSFTNEKGTALEFTLPRVQVYINYIQCGTQRLNLDKPLPLSGNYQNPQYCGNVVTTKGLLIFAYSGEASFLFLYNNDKVLKLLYVNKLGFDKNTYITAIANYETDKIEKVYWVDGVNQLRNININHSIDNGDNEDIQNIPPDILDAVPPYNLTQPVIQDVTFGGNHTAGMIQYVYLLYKKNGTSTNISSFSEFVPLSKPNSGGDVNENVGTLPVVRIKDIDQNFDNIRVFSIKYTSLGTEPTISIILDSEIPVNGEITVYDDNRQTSTVSTEEFLLSNLSSIYIPKDIESKDNRLFMSSYYEKNFKLDFDMRAYSFNNQNSCKIYHNLKSLTEYEGVKIFTPTNMPLNNDEKFDSINLNYDNFKFKANSTELGGTGRYCEYSLLQTTVLNEGNKYLKDGEIYRLGVIFYNKYGKYTEPMWVADFKTPVGNLEGNYNILAFNLTNEFYSDISSITDVYNKPEGYKVVIAERGEKDSYIVTSGIMSTMMVNVKNSSIDEREESNRINQSKTLPKLPNFLIRNYDTNSNAPLTYPLKGVKNYELMHRYIDIFGEQRPVLSSHNEIIGNFNTYGGRFWQYTRMMQMYNPELIFNNGATIPGGDLNFRVKGMFKNTFNGVWTKELDAGTDKIQNDTKGLGGISPLFSDSATSDIGNPNSALDNGLISHPGGSGDNWYHRSLWYRQYGIKPITESEPEGEYPTTNHFINVNGITISNIDPTYDPEAITDGSFLGQGQLNHKLINSQSDKVILRLKSITVTPDDNSIDYDCTLETNLLMLSDQAMYFNNKTGSFTYTPTTGGSYETPPNYNVIDGTYNTRISSRIRLHNSVSMTGNLKISYTLETKNSTGDTTLLCDIDIDQNFTISTNPNQNLYVPSNTQDTYKIKGSPEYTSRGQGFKNYNNDGEYRYTNNLHSMKTDGDSSWGNDGTYTRRIISTNASNANCITLVVKSGTSGDINYENLYLQNINSTAVGVMLGEVVRTDEGLYLGSMYGGNRFEEKLRTRYREIGTYVKLDSSNQIAKQTIQSPGDVFVQKFRFLRMSESDKITNQGTYQMEEIIEVPCETTIDLRNRNDESISEWDSKLVYDNDKYHKYNQVYSQKNSIISHKASEYYVKDEEVYDATVIPSKEKNAGELLDSWLQILPNDSLSLDGKYGPIRKLIVFSDNLISLQDKAVAILSVNPRIQIPTEDGAGLELGTGGVLPNYNYITQDSGTMSRHSVKRTPYGVYYFDNINNTVNVFNGKISPLSDTAGLHSYLQNKPLSEVLVNDPRNKQGVFTGYDSINRDVYMSFNYNDFTDTLVFNEKRNLFISRQEHRVDEYITNNDEFYMSNNMNNFHKLGKGNYNQYFGENYKTSITFIINPEVDLDTILNTIMFKSTVLKNNIDQPNNTITAYRAYNEFQDTGYIDVVPSKRGNARRYLRDWNIEIARNKNTRERIRNPWNYLELVFENNDDLELILNDIIVSYTV